MDFNIKDINETEKEIQIEIKQDELSPHFNEAFGEYQRKIEYPGFRKGKVPMSIIKKLYGESIEYEKLEKLADIFFKKISETQNIFPIGTPALIDMNYKRGESATYKIRYEVSPSFELKEYKGLTFENIIHEVTEKEVEDEIKRILNANATLEETQIVSDENHTVTYDMYFLDKSGTTIVGESLLDQRINLIENQYPEIKEALINSSITDEPIVQFERTENEQKVEYSAKLIIKKIEKHNLPELTDEFVKTITKDKIKSVPELKVKLKKDIQTFWDNMSEKRLKDTIIEKIVSGYSFTVPPSMVENLLQSYIERVKEQFKKKELPPDFDVEKYKKENYENAVEQIRWYFISRQIIEVENIKIDDVELEKLAEADAEKTGIEKERLLKYYKSSSTLQDKLLTEKLMAYLIENNNVEKIKE